MDVKVLNKLITSLGGTFVLASLIVGQVGRADDRVYTLPAPTTKLSLDEVSKKPLPSEKKVELKLTGTIGGISFANEQGEKNRSAVFNLGEEFKYRLTDTLRTNVEAKVYTFAGQSLSRFGDGVPSNGIYLKEALVDWKPFDFIALDGGAINQRYLNSSLLVYDKAFPGLRESATLKSGKFSGSVTAEQAVPTSSSLSTKTADREESPSFFAETLSGKFEVVRAFTIELFGTIFEFRDLPSQVAYDSSLYGNTPDHAGSIASTKFEYGYAGWLAGAKSEIELAKRQKLLIGGNLIENNLAPVAFNHGQIVSVGGEFGVNDNLSLNPSLESFFNESDSGPAYYNDYLYGHNNRQGYAAYLTLDFKKSNFKFTTYYVDSDVINFSLNQSRQQVLVLKLETAYDVL